MARDYTDFPLPEFRHSITHGKNNYVNKFFHDIDLSFILKWMEGFEGDEYTLRISGNTLQMLDKDGNVVSEVNLDEGQQGPPGVTPSVAATAYVDNNTGTPSVQVVRTGTDENPNFAFNFSNLKGAKGDTGAASTVPGPAGEDGKNFTIKGQYDTYEEFIAAHPTGQPGDAYQVGENDALAEVAFSGDYDDLLNKPTIPTVNDSTIILTQGGVEKGRFNLNQASGDTIDFDAGGSGGGGVAPVSWSVSGQVWEIWNTDWMNPTKLYDRSTDGNSYTFAAGSYNLRIYGSSKQPFSIKGAESMIFDPVVNYWIRFCVKPGVVTEDIATEMGAQEMIPLGTVDCLHALPGNIKVERVFDDFSTNANNYTVGAYIDMFAYKKTTDSFNTLLDHFNYILEVPITVTTGFTVTFTSQYSADFSFESSNSVAYSASGNYISE